jgi:dinuclear metal center YbgI/SA1388 family protein
MAAPLPDVLSTLERLAPLALAEDWDNVGLLVEPRPAAASSVSRVLLTIDLTEAVVAEATSREAELVVAYHPPIFSGLKRLTQSTAHERVVTRLLSDGVFVYSPHTALDSCEDGINDWLGRAFGAANVRPIAPAREGSHEGSGRLLSLQRALELETIVARLKAHLGIEHLRVARSKTGRNLVERVALCAGAGGSVLAAVEHVDLCFSGELRHHDILARVENGTHVIVSDHTHSERGYLPILAERLRQASNGKVTCFVSEVDDDPLSVV